ncbi:MAG: GDSL-type esterase/lipase family protein, partial [Planctomycetaceae bacterium]|nr:GDSL-type esterase/lipase family protein [Planctomycetaceae bacterium]
RATALIWLGIIALELPHQFAPRLEPLGSPPLWIIGDSATAGLGSNERTWPDLLPESVEVHNLAQAGATTAMAVKSQANQITSDGGVVLIEIGGNDLLLEGGSARQFERDLDALLLQVCGSAGASPSQAGASRRTVIMFELPLPPLCNEYGRIQRRLAARYGVRLIPKRVLIGVLAGGGATLDSIHLTNNGHQQMAGEVWAVISPTYR